MKKNPNQVKLERAAKYARNQNFSKAIPLYEDLVRKFPGQVELKLHLAHCLGLSGKRDQAYRLQSSMIEEFRGKAEILIRCARDRDMWQDFEGALELYHQVFASVSNFRREAAFHRARLFERVNQLDDAEQALVEAKALGFVDEQWGWSWIKGVLAARAGRLQEAEKFQQIAESSAKGDFRAKAASAIARLADRRGKYDTAFSAIGRIRSYREELSAKFRKANPINNSELDLIVPDLDGDLDDGPIFVAGLPRSGTSLLSRELERNYLIKQSEEYNYLSYSLDPIRRQNGALHSIQKFERFSPAERQKSRDSYFEAQKKTIGFQKGGAEALLDKNPSVTPLLPWLLLLFPNIKIIWIDRPLVDVWLSSAMQDIPLNATSCWWTTPKNYAKWAKSSVRLADRLEQELAPNRFQRISYEELVTQTPAVLESLAKAFGFSPRPDQDFKPKAGRSPSYAQVVQPITAKRLNRVVHYRELMSPDDIEVLSSLDA